MPPILSELILDRDPTTVSAWKGTVVSEMKFKTLITGHYVSPVPCTPKEVSRK